MNPVEPILPLSTVYREAGLTGPAAPGRVPGLNHQPVTTAQKALLASGQGFESLFLLKLLESMRSTVMESDLFGENSRTMKIFQSMQDEELSKHLASSGGIGLASLLYNQMVKSLPSGPSEDAQGPSSVTLPPGLQA